MNISPLVKILARYGAFAGVIGFGLLLGLYYMGKHPFLIHPIFDFRIVLLGVFIFFGLKEFREFHQEGILYFWQGMIGSFALTAVFAVVASSLIFLFGSWNEVFVQSYITEFTQQVNEFPPDVVDQIGKENMERNLMELQATTIGDMATTYLVQSFIISFFISIILSVVLRRQPKP
jgi:hypothetical protein